MAIERCERCGRLVDLDWHVDDIVYIDNRPVCVRCLDDAEREDYENGAP